jgi:hypothetical protein
MSPRRLGVLSRGLLATALLAAVSATPVDACDSSSCSLLTRNQGGLLLFPHQFRIDFSYRQSQEEVRLEGTRRVDEVLRPKLFLETGGILPDFHEERGGHEAYLQLDVGYGLTRRTSLQASIPLSTRRSYQISHVGFSQEYRTTGVGDMVLGVRQGLGPFVAGFALKLPTGDYRRRPDFDGSVLDPMLQPGSGSVDVVGSLQRGFDLAGLRWTAAATFQRNGVNDFSYRFGNEAIGAVSAGRTLVSRLSGSIQVKLYDQGRSVFRGREVVSTGATFVYLIPGVRWSFPAGASAYAYYQTLPYRRVNDAQVAPRDGFLVGVSKTF